MLIVIFVTYINIYNLLLNVTKIIKMFVCMSKQLLTPSLI